MVDRWLRGFLTGTVVLASLLPISTRAQPAGSLERPIGSIRSEQ